MVGWLYYVLFISSIRACSDKDIRYMSSHTFIFNFFPSLSVCVCVCVCDVCVCVMCVCVYMHVSSLSAVCLTTGLEPTCIFVVDTNLH